MENSMEVPQKTKNRTTPWSSNPIPGNIPGQNYNSKRYAMFIAALLTIAKTWKLPKRPLTDEWIKKMWYIYTMEYYSAIKKNKIMPFAATQRKTNTIWHHLYVEFKIWHKWTCLQNRNRLTDIEKGLVVAKGEGERKRKALGIWGW